MAEINRFFATFLIDAILAGQLMLEFVGNFTYLISIINLTIYGFNT